ncbi:MAG: hypothetical protein ACE5IR_10970 [bacterium]
MKSQLVEAWRMNNEANLYLLDNIASEYLEDSYSARTRTVAAQFAHIHNVRLRWLNHAAPNLVGDVKEADQFGLIKKWIDEGIEKAIKS